eukprot:Tamp_04181.p1 GENE.Tamp_04181~~Tamp_04181.p1  ORF type:complete len:968 (+),score=189.37 Tamp_04181:81-2906(+)
MSQGNLSHQMSHDSLSRQLSEVGSAMGGSQSNLQTNLGSQGNLNSGSQANLGSQTNLGSQSNVGSQPNLGSQSNLSQSDLGLAAGQGANGTGGVSRHLRFNCPTHSWVVTGDRQGQGFGNANFCAGCICFACGVEASKCPSWVSEGHCDSHEKDPYWRAYREYYRTEILRNSPLLTMLQCDKTMIDDARRWCIESLVAFQRYRAGKMTDDGGVNHSFHYVTDVASAGMKTIVTHLSGSMGPRGPFATLAVLDGMTSGMVVNTWRPKVSSNPRHRWCKGTFKAYKAIIEQLEKYWVLAIVYMSVRSAPTQVSWIEALEYISGHLQRLSAIASREITPNDTLQYGGGASHHVPLSHVVIACERGWDSPVVSQILQGSCHDLSQREVATLQKARLHVLERANRLQEAYHYAIFHGHIIKALSYMVRAGRQRDVLQMLKRQQALALGGKCLSVCNELLATDWVDYSYRIAIFCAFRDNGQPPGASDAGNRMPYVQWLIDQLKKNMDPGEWEQRQAAPIAGSNMDAVRRECMHWALYMTEEEQDLCEELHQDLPQPPEDAAFSHAFYSLERVAALSAVSSVRLHSAFAKVFMRNGDVTGAMSVVLGAGPEAHGVLAWALQELAPRVGYALLEPRLAEMKPESVPIAGQMQIALGLLAAQQTKDGIAWAKRAQCQGLSCDLAQLNTAAFDEARTYRPCDLEPFILAAQQCSEEETAGQLAELQLWWEPSYQHLKTLEAQVPAEHAQRRREQLKALVLSDATFKSEIRFEMLVREGETEKACNILIAVAKDDPLKALAALKAGLSLLGAAIVASSGVVNVLWPWLVDLISFGEGVDPVMEWLAPHFTSQVLQVYNQKVDAVQRDMLDTDPSNLSQLQQNKERMRVWLQRARRMHIACSQASQWDQRFLELFENLRRHYPLCLHECISPSVYFSVYLSVHTHAYMHASS